MSATNRQRGFTIVELILIIVIVGVLASVLIPQSLDMSNMAKQAACVSNQKALETAQILYYTQTSLNGNAQYATALSQLSQYIKSETLPECPSGGTYQLGLRGEISCSIPGHNE